MSRKEFELSPADLQELLEACRPVPYIVVGGMPPPSPQSTANAAWKHLGAKLSFDWKTVRPVLGKGQEFFTAEEVKAKDGEEGGRG